MSFSYSKLLLLFLLSFSDQTFSICKNARRIAPIRARCARLNKLKVTKKAVIRLLQARIARLRKLTVLTDAIINGNLTVNGNETINGDLLVQGNETINGTLNVTNNIVAPNIGTNFINAQKFTNQAITTSFANIGGFTVTNNNNWGFNSNDTFTVPATGTYKIEYIAHVLGTLTSLAPENISIRILANGAQINESPTVNSVFTPLYIETLSQSFLVNLIAGQTIILQVSSNAILTTPSLVAATVNGVLSPAVSLTITQIK